ncbi:MAG: AEC family transporter [Clostridia bacterium]|nr:AEC family transporter [Clostridia bacterium]MBR3715954.1 AEC family transporter [Clostridia bacterium]
MIDILALCQRIGLMFAMMAIGYIMRKAKLGGEKLPGELSNMILYFAQPALIIYTYIMDFDKNILEGALWVFVISIVYHGIVFALSLCFFKKAPEAKKKVYRYGMIFSNASFLGIPLVQSVVGDTAIIYICIFVIAFNIYAWSVGCYIYTGDKKYMSVKKMFINPATVPTYIGLVFFFTPLNTYVPGFVNELLIYVKELVVPVSMIIVGLRFADLDFKSAFKDKYLPLALVLRLFVGPLISFALIKTVMLCGVPLSNEVAVTIMICSSTPVAVYASMMAEKYNGDAVTAGKYVAVSTLFSLVTIPIVSLLLYL